MSTSNNALKNSYANAYYFLIALLPGIILTAYYSGLRWEGTEIFYENNTAIIKLATAIVTAFLVDVVMLIMTRQNLISTFKNPQALLIGILLALCLPNNLMWWEISISIAFAIIVGRYLLNSILHPVLVGYVFSLAAFPTSHGLSILIKNDIYSGHVLRVGTAFTVGGLFLVYKKMINWRITLSLLLLYTGLALLKAWLGAEFSLTSLHISHTTWLVAFFIAPFIVNNKANAKTCFMNGCIIAIVLFLLNAYAKYPDALMLVLFLMNLINWAVSEHDTSLNHNHITTLSSHVLLIPILSAGVAMAIASSLTESAFVGTAIIVIYLATQSISDVVKRYVPNASVLSLTIALTTFLSTYVGLGLKVFLPAFSQAIDNNVALLALSSIVLSCSGVFTGNHAPFKMESALKTSVLFLVFVLLMGFINQFTNLNRLFPAGLFFVFALMALCNNQKLSIVEAPSNKPNRRVRTTGTIK